MSLGRVLVVAGASLATVLPLEVVRGEGILRNFGCDLMLRVDIGALERDAAEEAETLHNNNNNNNNNNNKTTIIHPSVSGKKSRK